MFLNYYILLDIIIRSCQTLKKELWPVYFIYAVFSEAFSGPFLFSLPSLSAAGVVPSKPYSSGPFSSPVPKLAFREWTPEV